MDHTINFSKEPLPMEWERVRMNVSRIRRILHDINEAHYTRAPKTHDSGRILQVLCGSLLHCSPTFADWNLRPCLRILGTHLHGRRNATGMVLCSPYHFPHKFSGLCSSSTGCHLFYSAHASSHPQATCRTQK